MHWEPDTSRQVDELEGLNELVPLEQDHTRAKLVSSPTVPLLDSVCYSVVIGHDIRRAHRPNHSLPPCNVSSFSFEGAHRLASWPATTCPSLSVNKRPRALSRGNAFSYANPSTDRVVRTRSSSMDGQRNSCACRGSDRSPNVRQRVFRIRWMQYREGEGERFILSFSFVLSFIHDSRRF